jgi:hypothetical protein
MTPRTPKVILVTLLALILILAAGWWFTRRQLSARPTSEASPVASSTKPIAETTTNAPAPKSEATPATAPAAQKSVVADKKTVMQEIWSETNSETQDFYGLIVDQAGQPVPGATATGTLMRIQGFDVGEKREILRTVSDSNGDFQFTGIKGWKLGVTVQKDGYEMGFGHGTYRGPAAGNGTDPAHRGTFTMWKRKGAEALAHSRIQVMVPCDGRATSYSLLTGRAVDSGEDLTVTFVRNPVEIDRGRHFDWRLVLAMAEGGIQEIHDIYPNEAPAEGYEPSITISMAADAPHWTSRFVHSYYFKARNSKIFGRIAITLVADFEPPPTSFEAEIFANSNGSRNLEYDPSLKK